MIAATVPPNPDTGIVASMPWAMGVEVSVPTEADLWAWMDHAACRGVGCEEFFGRRAVMAKGRARCRVCPVAEICFWWAVVAESDLGYRFGIWGGTTPGLRARTAWVTGVDYARVRFVAEVAQWTRASSTR